MQTCEDIAGYRYVRTWEYVDVYEDMGVYGCVMSWEDIDVRGHGRMQMC